ncbi:CCA tRNA nucleotidyltransferase [Acetobacter conturbans]|uniref:CCA tRNA nucleotidyltransferase n=1 Tax=Acetobacter conturbans TaxID=1737472 RepID=A0ABX0K1U1_9PROT|nr:CCA tRNA nucleotidyltransferase [Acetobacter conturbans]NHN87684.1 CCA tRNA nucleotidyltransferase [Acetobacter conturbans]
MRSEDRLTLHNLPDFPAIERIWQVLPSARLVGGAVRDLLKGVSASDFDFGTPVAPQDVMEMLKAAGIRAIPTGLAHGTVTAVIDGRGFEVTTLRRDERTDGRHAEVAWTSDWREDASRRDFTINAMSCDSDGRVHDYFGGFEDLAAGHVRFVGDARTRIREDALRILRFFRFQARFGSGEPDEETLAAIAGCVNLIELLSVERIWSELRRLLTGPNVVAILRLMDRTNVLTTCLPELKDHAEKAVRRVEALIGLGAPSDELLRLAALLAGSGSGDETVRKCLARLRLSRAESDAVLAMLGEPVPHPARILTEEDGLRLLAELPREIWLSRTWLAEAREKAEGDTPHSEAPWQTLRQMLSDLPMPVFPLAGRDLLAMGLPPGPKIGDLLAVVHTWWKGNGCRADKEAALAYLRRVIVS